MVLATALMVLEKLPALGARLRVPLGVALLLGALAVVTLPHDTASPHQHMSLSAKGNQ